MIYNLGGVALVHKPNSGDSSTEALSLIQTNGIRGKSHPIGLAIQNGTLAPGLTAKNGTIYKQQAQVSGMQMSDEDLNTLFCILKNKKKFFQIDFSN